MDRQWLPSLTGLVACVMVLFQSGPAFSHGSWWLSVPRRDVSQAAPTVDGQVSQLEYWDAWRHTTILYQPRFPYHYPARLYLVATPTHLYVAIYGMPRGTGSTTPFVSLVFDTAHNGGSVPLSDDIVFELMQDGTGQAKRGDGIGSFVLDPTITGWTAVRALVVGNDWSAEFRIPLSQLGGGAPAATIGFHVRHNWVRDQGDDFVWPPTGGWNVPDSWADLEWLPIPDTPGVGLDAYRITQGVEYDQAGWEHDFVAGKDVLVRAQLYADGPMRSVTGAECVIQCLPPLGWPQTVRAGNVKRLQLNRMPYGYFNGSPVFDFWVPGSAVEEPGDYAFTLQVYLEGIEEPRRVSLSTRTFKATRDLRLLLVLWYNTFDAGCVPWSLAHIANMIPVLWNTNRVFPLRTGVDFFRFYPDEPRGGLRWWVGALGRCDPSDPDGRTCDNRGRQLGNDALARMNASLARLSQADRRDRYDFTVLLASSSATGGGQAQPWWNPWTAGLGFDAETTGTSGFVFPHETAHLLRQVETSSPRYTAVGGGHTSDYEIRYDRGVSAINMLNRIAYSQPKALMHPYINGHDGRTRAAWVFTTCFEWNSMRRHLLALPSRLSAPAPRRQDDSPLFHMAFTINVLDQVTVNYSERITDLPLELTPTDPSSPYRLVFLSGGSEIGGYPFKVTFEAIDGVTTSAGMLITTPLPAGSTRAEIRRNQTVLAAVDFSAQPPVVGNVVATASGQGGVDVQWTASDPDSTDLTYNIFFQPTQGGMRQLVASGIPRTTFNFPTDVAPATTDGRLIVEATDGINTGEAVSNPFTIPPQPPVVAIAQPTSGTRIVADQSVMLIGSAYDFTSGPLTGDALAWNSDRIGSLGTGDRLEVSLNAGVHRLTLTATAPSGLSTSASVDVYVLDDSDQDGLPDEYEARYGCLSSSTPDANEDPDGDGLTSLEERARGTNPCEADSDLDGFADGDEVKLGSDPLDTQKQPLPDLLYIAENEVDLGSCHNPLTQIINVRTTSSTITWAVHADSPWIEAMGGGQGDGQITVRALCRDLPAGTFTGHLMVTAAGGQTRLLNVSLDVVRGTASRSSWRLYK